MHIEPNTFTWRDTSQKNGTTIVDHLPHRSPQAKPNQTEKKKNQHDITRINNIHQELQEALLLNEYILSTLAHFSMQSPQFVCFECVHLFDINLIKNESIFLVFLSINRNY